MEAKKQFSPLSRTCRRPQAYLVTGSTHRGCRHSGPGVLGAIGGLWLPATPNGVRNGVNFELRGVSRQLVALLGLFLVGHAQGGWLWCQVCGEACGALSW